MGPIKDGNLYIWLGMDNLFCLNLKQLLFSKVEPELEKVFSLCNEGSEYPSDMRLIVMDSKLHFLGGQNLNQEGSDSLDFKHYFNEKVFSFNLPSFTPDHSSCFPKHIYDKPRPFVFTISNKVYALATLPFSGNLLNLFEVFETKIRKWRPLPLPPIPALCTIKRHFVFQNNLLIQTVYGDYIFDANEEMEKWMPFDKFVGVDICAILNYKEHILVLTRDPVELVAYKLESFYSSTAGVQLHIGDMNFDYSDSIGSSISWASFNIVENNFDYISLVFISKNKIHVYLFRFIMKDVRQGTYAHPEAYQIFNIPEEGSPDFNLYSTFRMCTKDDEENPTAVSQLVTNRDRYLYISLGYDNLFSLNFNELCSGKSKLDLKLLFTHCDRGSEYPFGMGSFFLDSQFHFFGGENLEDGQLDTSDFCFGYFENLRESMGLAVNLVRPKYGEQGHLLSKNSPVKCGEEWSNKKVFSFNLPGFTPVNNSTLIPNHSSFKFRPFVFTISNKVYALSRSPLSILFSYTDIVDDKKLRLFEVYDRVENKWRDLEDPHPDLCKRIRGDALIIISHCVFKSKLLLQTGGGDYLFTPSGDSGDWLQVDGKFPSIWASVEYNDKFLLVLTRNPNKLVAYESASFGEKKSTPTELYIYNNVIEFFKFSEGASLHLVDHNLINLVFVIYKKIHVMVFKVEIPFKYAVLEVNQVIDIPIPPIPPIPDSSNRYGIFNLKLQSSYLLQSDADQHADTKVDPREKKKRRVYQKNQKIRKGEEKRIKHMIWNEGTFASFTILRKRTKKIKKGEKKRIKHMISNEKGGVRKACCKLAKEEAILPHLIN